MTKAEAIVYFAELACDMAHTEGDYEARGFPKHAAKYHARHMRYENCIRWLLGIRRYYEE